MLRINTNQLKNFKKIIECISHILSDVLIVFNENGFFIQGMDSSSVTLAHTTFKKSFFTDYSCTKNIEIKVNLKQFLNIMKCCSEDDNMQISLNDKNINKLDIITFNEKDNTFMKFNMSLMDFKIYELEIPLLEYDYHVVMNCSEFRNIILNFNLIGDELKFSCKENEFIISARGEFVYSMKKFTNDSKNLKRKIDKACNVELYFSSKFMELISKSYDISNDVNIFLKSNSPLCITYDLDNVKIEYYVAPKIKD